jgi:hypothetical protein
MASVVTASPAADGLPREAGYTNGFTMLSGALLIAAVAGLLIPVGRRTSRVEYVQESQRVRSFSSDHPADQPRCG